ncbi:MAG: thioredoxin-disulfide reductase, partial [Candidatus Krumholzibacteria bacterium]|nr:thioredoxin-disulfide reductase [Candidatus Krumholzibacteria bacterium]
MYDVTIIGSGPAGLTAAIYICRSELRTLVVEGMSPGGQLMTTTEVENFPGFPEGIQGPELMARMKEQAGKFGAEFRTGDVTAVDLDSRPFKVTSGKETIETRTIIIAAGASYRWLGLESETRLRGRGVSACATCDGFFYSGKEIAVVGGGDAAVEEAIFLTRFAKKVTIIHRRDELRAGKALKKKAFENDKIEFEWDSVVEDILDPGQNRVTALILRNVKTGEKKKLPVEGAFIAIGHNPMTSIFTGKLDIDEKGYIVTKENTQTSVPGVFA